MDRSRKREMFNQLRKDKEQEEPLVASLKKHKAIYHPDQRTVIISNRSYPASDIFQAIEQTALHCIVPAAHVRDLAVDIDFGSTNWEQKRVIDERVTVGITATRFTQTLHEEFAVPISLRVADTKEHRVTASNYYEGILQLRRCSNHIVDFAREFLSHHNVVVAKEIQNASGVDWFVSDKKFLYTLAEQLKQRFGGTTKYSNKLYSRDHLTQKEIYRMTALFRPFGVQKNDVFTVDDRVFVTEHISGNIQAIDVDNKMKVTFADDQGMYLFEEIPATLVSVQPLHVLLEDTFETVEPTYVIEPFDAALARENGVIAIVADNHIIIKNKK